MRLLAKCKEYISPSCGRLGVGDESVLCASVNGGFEDFNDLDEGVFSNGNFENFDDLGEGTL